jgi:hypothetical protein
VVVWWNTNRQAMAEISIKSIDRVWSDHPRMPPGLQEGELLQPIRGQILMTHKYRECIVVLLINKSVEPNEEQKV